MLDPKWTGTEVDRREMRTLQLKQVVRRNFSAFPMFGFSTTLLCTWEVIAGTFNLALMNGGTAGLFWNYIIAAIGLGFAYASIAEMASMFPTSGGQYFWVAVLAPRPYRRFLSFITGWLCAITWQAAACGAVYFAATMTQGLIILNYPDTYAPKQWHGTLLMFAYLAFAIVFNTFLAKRLPLLEGMFVILHVLGVLIFIPLWALSPIQQGGSPLTEFYNPSGWSSNGVATLVGALAPVTALIGFDCSVHMAEEAKDSSRVVPVTLLAGYTTNVVLGFFTAVTCIYTVGSLNDPATLAPTPNTGYIIINMFYKATGSHAATNFVIAIILLAFTASSIACIAAASRQLWAFARNGGIPFARYFAPDNLPHDIPINAVVVSGLITVIIALINIGSTLALLILISIVNSALIASYTITICCILFHRIKGDKLLQARFSLGKWGALCNVVALVYILPIFIFSFFPAAPNPTPSTMNWAIVLVGGIIIGATVYYWLGGRRTYTPPEETVDDYVGQSEATMKSDMEIGVAEGKAANQTVSYPSVDEAEKRD